MSSHASFAGMVGVGKRCRAVKGLLLVPRIALTKTQRFLEHLIRLLLVLGEMHGPPPPTSFPACKDQGSSYSRIGDHGDGAACRSHHLRRRLRQSCVSTEPCGQGLVAERVVLADVPPERKPERGYIRMFPRNENRNGGTFVKTALLQNCPFVSW